MLHPNVLSVLCSIYVGVLNHFMCSILAYVKLFIDCDLMDFITFFLWKEVSLDSVIKHQDMISFLSFLLT